MEHAQTSPAKKEQIVSVLTQGWLEKLLEHIGMVLQTTRQDNTQAAMILKDLFMNIASALEIDGSSSIPNAENMMETATDNESEPESSDDDSSSASDSSADSDDDCASLAPRAFMRYPMTGNAYAHPQPDAIATKPANTEPVGSGNLQAYTAQAKRYKRGSQEKYTLLFKVGSTFPKNQRRSAPKKSDVKGSLIMMVKNSAHPQQAWSSRISVVATSS